jgi:hypothetical protein
VKKDVENVVEAQNIGHSETLEMLSGLKHKVEVLERIVRESRLANEGEETSTLIGTMDGMYTALGGALQRLSVLRKGDVNEGGVYLVNSIHLPELY